MSISSDGFVVILESFARNHYCKDFERRASWKATWSGLEQTFARFNAEILAGKLEIAAPLKDPNLLLYKMRFRMADDHKGANSFDNGIIFTSEPSKRVIRVLLVYAREHIRGSRERDWWMGLVGKQYKILLSAEV